MLSFVTGSDTGFPANLEVWVTMCINDGVMMDPYAHSQHMETAKHLFMFDMDAGLFWVGLQHQPMNYIINCNQWWPTFSSWGGLPWSRLPCAVITDDDGPKCPSTAYGDCPTPLVFLRRIQLPFLDGLQPQLLNYDFNWNWRSGLRKLS